MKAFISSVVASAVLLALPAAQAADNDLAALEKAARAEGQGRTEDGADVLGVCQLIQHDDDALADGDVVPACMEACSAGAITFGDIHAPESRVAELSKSPRAMKLLDALGVKPSISYLTKVRNDKA